MSAGIIDYKHLFQALNAPIMILDRDLRFVEMNTAYLHTTGRARDDLVGKYVFDAFPEDAGRLSALKASFDKALAGEQNTLFHLPYAVPASKDCGGGGGVREAFWTCTHTPLKDGGGEIAYLVQHTRDVTGEVEAERRQRAVSAELDHRVNNILAIVSTVGRRTAREAESTDDFLKTFDARISAMARTHAALAENRWDGLTLDFLVGDALAPFAASGDTRISTHGEAMRVPVRDAQTLSMALHEMAVNASAAGALSRPGGRLDVAWRRLGNAGYEIVWRETGLKGIEVPKRKGFGSIIVEDVTRTQLGATIDCDYLPTGLVCTIRVERDETLSGPQFPNI